MNIIELPERWSNDIKLGGYTRLSGAPPGKWLKSVEHVSRETYEYGPLNQVGGAILGVLAHAIPITQRYRRGEALTSCGLTSRYDIGDVRLPSKGIFPAQLCLLACGTVTVPEDEDDISQLRSLHTANLTLRLGRCNEDSTRVIVADYKRTDAGGVVNKDIGIPGGFTQNARLIPPNEQETIVRILAAAASDGAPLASTR